MSWLAFLLSLFGASWAGVGFFRAYAIRKGMLDQPNGRSSHYAATARGGGIVFFMSWMILIGVLFAIDFIPYSFVECFYPVLLMGWVGYWDDKKGLSSLTRFIFQCIAAGSFLFLIHEDGSLIHSFISLSYPYNFGLIALGIVWMTNLYNFMDGSDGMAAQEALFFFTMSGYFLFQNGAIELGILAWGLSALLAGFLVWNWPVAKIFMGDSGSYFLGFTIAIYAIIAHKFYDISLIISAILTGLFWFDATVTLLRRAFNRENWRKPHRLHAYQRLIQHGWSHQSVLLASISVNAVLAALGYLAFKQPHLEMFSLYVALILLALLYSLVELMKPMYRAWYGIAR